MTEKNGQSDFISGNSPVTMGFKCELGGVEVINTLINLEKLMQEHEVIQANIKLIANSADNLLILSSLQETMIDFTYYQVNFL